MAIHVAHHVLAQDQGLEDAIPADCREVVGIEERLLSVPDAGFRGAENINDNRHSYSFSSSHLSNRLAPFAPKAARAGARG